MSAIKDSAMTKHTPGPWIAIPMRRRHLIYGERDEPIFPDGLWYILPESNPEQCPIAIIDRANDHDAPTRADAETVARLIAAAPDLLAALKKAAPGIDELHGQGIGCPDCQSAYPEGPNAACNLIGLIESAIAKAEGK